MSGNELITIDIEKIYGGDKGQTAKIDMLEEYIREILKKGGEGKEVILTGRGPVWLYLKAAHALHGKVRKLLYDSPVSGNIEICDHNPF